MANSRESDPSGPGLASARWLLRLPAGNSGHLSAVDPQLVADEAACTTCCQDDRPQSLQPMLQGEVARDAEAPCGYHCRTT
jgi:hypothetical protein